MAVLAPTTMAAGTIPTSRASVFAATMNRMKPNRTSKYFIISKNRLFSCFHPLSDDDGEIEDDVSGKDKGSDTVNL